MLFKEDVQARAQHDAVRNKVGWYRWTHDLIEVTGADAAQNLNLLFVNTIDRLERSSCCYTTMLNEAGQIIDDVIVMRMGPDQFWISTLYGPQMVQWIESHKADQAITVRNITGEWTMVAVQGPDSPATIESLTGESFRSIRRFTFRHLDLNGMPLLILRAGFTGEVGYEIYVPRHFGSSLEQLVDRIVTAQGGLKLTVLEVYVRSLPGEKGYPLRQDLYGLNPLEAGLDWSVDLSKEFIGKEAVLTIQSEGPRKKLVGLEFLAESYEDVCQGERIHCRGVDIGSVRAAMYGYTIDRNIGFAIIDSVHAIPGNLVEVGINDTPARITERRWL